MKSRVIFLALIAMTVATLASSAAVAGERPHEVLPGESASSIAKRYYGSFEPTSLLLLYNGKTHSVIRPGESLRIPYGERHVVRPGDTWSALSQKYLGQPSGYTTIAALNGVPAERALQVGQELVMPVVFQHRLERGDSLSSLAERYYGTTDLASILMLYNEIENPRRLSVGQTIGVPLISLELDTASATPVSRIAEKAPPPPEPLFASEIQAAGEAFQKGEFARSNEILDSLRAAIDTSPVVAERDRYWELAAFVHVAFDQNAQACDAYLRVGDKPTALDRDLVSPKIRRTLEGCSR